MSILNKIISVFVIFLLFQVNLSGQSRYAVQKLPFSSPRYDEFCPSIWEDQLIFCSNQEGAFLFTYQDSRNKGLFNIFTVSFDTLGGNSKPAVLSKALVTPFNDGPASFGPNGKQMAYSRNQEVDARLRNVFELSNRLGIYFAELENEVWVPKGEFPYNHPEYSLTTPCYSPDGRFLYFASDHPKGYGGSDLYRSEWNYGSWSEPQNLGPEINTEGNEAYPFIAANGDLYFASDGHGGLGGKDIFLTRLENGQWMRPIHLEYPINSEDDDFGLITNGDFSEGFLSTSRERSDDIYRFYTHIPQLFDCESMLTNNYCYEFWDEDFPGNDSLMLTHEWTFSDGTIKTGVTVSHCFPGAGPHWARLNIIDERTDTIFYTQSTMEVLIEDHEQPFITSETRGAVDAPMAFSGLSSNLPGFTVEQYIWEFGDGAFTEGAEVEHLYEKSGTYSVRLGLKGYMEGESEQQIRCVERKIEILNHPQE
jgi:hypothetical protein